MLPRSWKCNMHTSHWSELWYSLEYYPNDSLFVHRWTWSLILLFPLLLLRKLQKVLGTPLHRSSGKWWQKPQLTACTRLVHSIAKAAFSSWCQAVPCWDLLRNQLTCIENFSRCGKCFHTLPSVCVYCALCVWDHHFRHMNYILDGIVALYVPIQ